MNPKQDTLEKNDSTGNKHPLFQVTPTSKYAAMLLFIAMPFIGGWIGYSLAPIKTVVVETTTVVTAPEESASVSIESATVVNEGDIEVTLSDGQKKVVARAKKPQTEEEYYEIETYQEAFVSPNRAFVALQGIGFEDSFVRIYNVVADRLENKIYGEVTAWDNVGRLGILACDLSGEECTNYISVSPETPWILEEIN